MNNVVLQAHLKDVLKSLPQPKIQYPTKTQQTVKNVKLSASVIKPNSDPAIKG